LIADQSNHRIRRVTPGTNGVVEGGSDAANEMIGTVAGTGAAAVGGGGGAGAAGGGGGAGRGGGGGEGAGGGEGREGQGEREGGGRATFGGDGGAATWAGINAPWSVSVDGTGALLIADRGNHRIRKVAPGAAAGVTGDADETITTVAGTGGAGYNGDGQAATL